MKGLLQTGTVLDRIVAAKEREVEALKGTPAPAPRAGVGGFEAALRRPGPGRAVIAEIKKASPSAGVIREDFDPAEIAKVYRARGARCISVLTDSGFFQGSFENLDRAQASSLPLLCKDFIIDPAQIDKAAGHGASCVLLIARILEPGLFADLLAKARESGLEALCEVHDRDDLEKTLGLSKPPTLIGVNNRNLADFTVTIERTLELLPLMPKNVTVVSESGLSDPAALDRLSKSGAHAFLIGTAIMRERDFGVALSRFTGVG